MLDRSSPTPSPVGHCNTNTAGAGADHGTVLENPGLTVVIRTADSKDKDVDTRSPCCTGLRGTQAGQATHPTGTPTAHATGPGENIRPADPRACRRQRSHRCLTPLDPRLRAGRGGRPCSLANCQGRPAGLDARRRAPAGDRAAICPMGRGARPRRDDHVGRRARGPAPAGRKPAKHIDRETPGALRSALQMLSTTASRARRSVAAGSPLDASSSPTTRRVPAPATGEVEDVASGTADARARRNRRHDVSVS